jgi:hypothetical protein
MSSADTTINLIASLDYASSLLNRYVPIFIYIFGIIGNMLNVLVLSQRILRSNSSAVCFLVSSIVLWMIILAAIDRWLSSANITVNLRQLSNLKNTQRCIFIIFIYTGLINSPIIYCYEANLTGIPRGC